MGLLQPVQFTLPTVDVMGAVHREDVAVFDRVTGALTCSGPPGPWPVVARDRIVPYDWALTEENYFGTCEVTISGVFQMDVEVEIPPPPPPPLGAGGGWAAVFYDL